MAGFETVMMALQTMQNLENLRRNLRDNAQAYKAYLAAGRPVPQIAAVMQGDALEYLRRLKWQKDIADTPARRAKLLDGLAAWGISEAEATAFYSELRQASVAQRDAVIVTGADVTATADAVLASVSTHDQVFQAS